MWLSTFYGLHATNKGFLFASESSLEVVNQCQNGRMNEVLLSLLPGKKTRTVRFYQQVQGHLEISVGIESKASISFTPLQLLLQQT
jgi:hypothetical protein